MLRWAVAPLPSLPAQPEPEPEPEPEPTATATSGAEARQLLSNSSVSSAVAARSSAPSTDSTRARMLVSATRTAGSVISLLFYLSCLYLPPQPHGSEGREARPRVGACALATEVGGAEPLAPEESRGTKIMGGPLCYFSNNRRMAIVFPPVISGL